MTRSARRYGSSPRASSSQPSASAASSAVTVSSRADIDSSCSRSVEFGQVVRQRGERGAAGGQPHHVGGHVRVSVAVAADPGARLQNWPGQQVGVGPPGPQRLPDLGVDLRYHLEQRGRVIPQPDRDLVGDLQPRQPYQRGLPQRQDLAAQFQFDVAAVVGLGMPLRVQPHQLGDPVLGDEDGAPPGLGGMCGDDRRNQSALQCVGHGGRIQFCQIEFGVGGGQAAVLRRFAGLDVNTAATLPVDVFGDIGQQREMAERPDDRDRQVDVDPVEHRRHLGPIDL